MIALARARPAARLSPRAQGLVATTAVAALAVCVLVGRTVLLHPGRGIVGSNPSSDFQIMTWSLRWWPWAIWHGVDPLHSSLLWAPEGFPTVWMTTIPAPALLALPVTLLGSPLLAYNLLMLAAVLLASAAAYLLCFELTGRVAASVLGGLVFGLSPYMLGHTLSQHLNLVFVFPLPLLALLALRLARGKTSPARFVSGTAVLLLVLAGSSLELFADLALLLVVVGAIAIAADRARRPVLVRLAKLVALAYAVCLPVLGPVGAFALTQPHGSVQGAPANEAVDLLGLVVPTPLLLLGTHWTQTVSGHFVGNVGERDGYIGLPLLAVTLLALRANRRRAAWIAGLFGAVALLLSFGPVVTFEGRPLFSLPVSAADLPVLGNALPARLSVFVALALACLAALWFAQPGRRRLRLAVAAVVVASLLPNVLPPTHAPDAWARTTHFAWSTPAPPAGFVDAPGWQTVVPAGTNVLVLPTRDRTASSFWQVRGGYGFALALPETPFSPPALAADQTVARLADDVLPQLDGTSLAAARLRAYASAYGIGAIVVPPTERALWRPVAARASGARPRALAGSLVYPVKARLRPLSASGESVTASAPDGFRVRAWLAFDGTRARVRVQLGSAAPVTVSAPQGDAESPAVAVAPHGRAAVAFTEWRDGRQLLRVATTTGSGWHTTTLDSAALPIWTPRVAVARDGTVVAAWVVVRGSYRDLRAALRPPGGAWRTRTLDSGGGLGAIALRPAGGDIVALAWHDSLANEERVQAATVAGGRWQPTATVARRLARLDSVLLTRNAASVWWRAWQPGREEFYAAHRHGTSWGPAELRKVLP